ncbi:hypothetical protein D1007_13682 [Hordeum vulgare]|nr:hypothetical protein D1007_13682 [Hordeum vulgare]
MKHGYGVALLVNKLATARSKWGRYCTVAGRGSKAAEERREAPAWWWSTVGKRRTSWARESYLLRTLNILRLLKFEKQATRRLNFLSVFVYVDGTSLERAGFLITKNKDGKETAEPNPRHPIWVREEHQVLGYLLDNLTKEVPSRVGCGHPRARALGGTDRDVLVAFNNIRAALINTQKGNQSVATYFDFMHGLADELTAPDKLIQDDELLPYLLHGLDMDYQQLVSALNAV